MFTGSARILTCTLFLFSVPAGGQTGVDKTSVYDVQSEIKGVVKKDDNKNCFLIEHRLYKTDSLNRRRLIKTSLDTLCPLKGKDFYLKHLPYNPYSTKEAT